MNLGDVANKTQNSEVLAKHTVIGVEKPDRMVITDLFPY